MSGRLLLIESDKYLKYQIARGLRRRGFKVRTVKNCVVAGSNIRQETPTAILLGLGNEDDHKPAMDLVNSIPDQGRPPLIVLGLAASHPVAEAIKPRACLDIPFGLNELRDVIIKVLKKSAGKNK